MTQTEINNLLKKNPDVWHTTKEIVDLLNSNFSVVSKKLQRLRDKKSVTYRLNKTSWNYYQYKFKNDEI